MRKSIVACLLLTSAVASAQPGADPQAPPPMPQPAPLPYSPGPGYGPPIQLTIEDQELLAQGEISDGEHYGGAALSVVMGFGIGQAFQGRWSDRGYIFTLGELGAVALMMYGTLWQLTNCDAEPACPDGLGSDGMRAIVVGLIGFGALRIWEIVDAVTGPTAHNERVRALRVRSGFSPVGYGQIKPFVAPGHDQGISAGISFRF